MRILSAFAPMVALAIGVTFAAPASALAAHSGRQHVVQMHRFGNATALVPALPFIRAVPARDSDGLSRDTDDCNRGCIDNGR